MKKFLTALLLGSLLFASPSVVSAAEETTYESEQGQAMIKAPSSSAFSDGNTTDADSTTDSSDSAGNENTEASDSSAIDWSAANTASRASSDNTGFTVCIDPGHQGSWVDMSAQEPMAPGSSQTKNKATTGTSGNYSKVPEYEVNLQVSLVLEKELTSRGYNVVMTREDNDKAISNKERAELATSEGADITVRIHANSDNSASAAGALTMSPTSANQYLDADLIKKSNTLSECIINSYCAATGLANKGVISADNMTGTNWSTVPVTILEMGFMSNESDDMYITDTSHHETMAKGIADGIDEYFNITAPDIAAVGEHLSDLTASLEKTYVDPLEKNKESWAIAAMDLTDQAYSTVNAEASMQSSSVIKAFIMAAVYDKLVYPNGASTASDNYETTLKPLLTQMITADDDRAANKLVRMLGGGKRFRKGAAVLNDFCTEHGYSSTHLGRKFRASNPKDDNYTSASDCCRLLADIYNGTMVNADASAEMLALLKSQTFTDNSTAIVSDKDHPYVLCVLSNNVKSNADAQATIKKISSDVDKYMTSRK